MDDMIEYTLHVHVDMVDVYDDTEELVQADGADGATLYKQTK